MAESGGWFHCKVDRAGPAREAGERVVYVLLTDSDKRFSGLWFTADKVAQREMLATALAAITTGFAVSVYLDSMDEYSNISRMYLLKD